jgi:hypothetical protein
VVEVEVRVHARKRVEGQLVAWWGKCKGADRGSLHSSRPFSDTYTSCSKHLSAVLTSLRRSELYKLGLLNLYVYLS